MELETDANGIVTFMPIIRWGVSIVEGKTVGLAVDYYASAADAAAKRTSRVQLHVDALAARDLGRALTARADTLLSGAARPT
ncbi:MAG TPA: hypothetical protein VMT68_17320 [Caulobacteraceae bacterium]|nr:hypothetical protein [Caulobacteraceae bacterium]